jgi:hypothetical protein
MKCKICGTGFCTCSLYIQGQGRQLPFSFLCDIFILLNVNMHVLNVNQSFFYECDWIDLMSFNSHETQVSQSHHNWYDIWLIL